jgi:hypothetical protein
MMLKTRKAWNPRKKATHLASFEASDAAAVRALEAGTATAEQQQMALSWIITQASGMYELNYYDTDRETAFALGRANVGQQIVTILNSRTEKE